MLKAKVIKIHTNGNYTYQVGETRPVLDKAQMQQLVDSGLVEEISGGKEEDNRETKIEGPAAVKTQEETNESTVPAMSGLTTVKPVGSEGETPNTGTPPKAEPQPAINTTASPNTGTAPQTATQQQAQPKKK